MTNRKTTKKALIFSALSLLLCFSMLVGTTFAWFTDSVTSSGNIIKSGTLDVALDWADGTEALDKATWKDASKGAIFESKLWEPGYTEARHLKISNNGTLALKYELAIIPNGAVSALADVIDVYYIDNGAQVADRTALKDENKIGTLRDLINGGICAGSLEKNGAKIITLVLKMQETAGNEYQDLSIGTDFAIQLLATQMTYEKDSFDKDYDEDATLGTYIELEAGDDLLAAMASAQADMPLTISLNGDVEWPTEGHHGENDITPASSIVIIGNGNTITATGSGVTPLGDTEAPMTLKNVKIVDNSVSYDEDAWELSYLEMGGKVLNCVDVDFADPITVDSDVATFTGCTFVGHYDKNSTGTGTTQYGVWVSNGDTTFTDCTFTGTRGLKICDKYASEVGTVVVDGCTFNGISEKPGVAIDDCDTQDMKITIKNSVFMNCQAGDQGLYVYETDNTVPTVENNTVESYNSIVEIGTKADLFAFAQRVNGGDGMDGVLVKLTADIDLAGEEWIPVGQTGTSYGAISYFKGIFDGQGHTISNMTITNTNSGKNYAAGFFGFIDAADCTIKDVNFDKANVKGHHWVGVVAGYLTGKISNCNVTNSTVKCTHANDDACGDKAGAIVGYINSGLVSGCSASDTEIVAGRDAGQIVGASKTDYVDDCTATNVTVTAGGDCTGANVKNEVIGRVLG